MKAAFTYAVAHKFDYCTSTLSISPYKDAEKINTAGKQLEQEFKNLGAETKYLYADFKKKNGFKRSLELSSQYNLYRQNYCCCIFSIRNVKTIQVSDKSPLHKSESGTGTFLQLPAVMFWKQKGKVSIRFSVTYFL